MNDETHEYHAYLLRLWRSEHQGQWQWHASLESPHTVERQSFTSLEQLFAFLSERCSNRGVGDLEVESGDREDGHEDE